MKKTLLAIAISCFCAPHSHADDTSQFRWSQWRGPTANGVAAETATPPLEWDTKQNVAWVAELRGTGSATPVVWDDKIFLLSAEKTDRKAERPNAKHSDAKTEPPEFAYRFVVMCLDRTTGKLLWEQIAAEAVPHEGCHPTHTYAAGSPVTDGQRVYASFGSRGLFAYSLSGELLWQKDLGDMRTRYGWGEAVTPVLAGNRLIVNWDQEENSFIVALNAATGDELWKRERPGEVTSWNTPLITDVGGKTVAVVNGSGKARAYDVSTGNVLWECSGQTTNAIPSPIRFEDAVICMSGYKGAAAMAIPLDSSGDVTNAESLKWKRADGTPYVPSPTLSHGRLYFTGGNADILTILNAATGKPTSEKLRLGIGNTYASPLVANGRVYFVGREGTTVVVSDEDQPKILAKNVISETFDASPVAVGSQFFLRSWSRLYCIEEKP